MIRIAVIGSGAAADRHLRAIGGLPGARLAGVHDPAEGGPDSVESLLLEADAAIVASPAELRFHHSALVLEHGLDLLVEQPVALTVDNARMLDRIASLRPLRPVVMASGAWRFDPAVGELRRLLDASRPASVELRRLVPAGALGAGAEVVRDLMLPDLELLVAIARSPLVRLHASAGATGHTIATLVFESGLIGSAHAGLGGGPAQVQVLATTAAATFSLDVDGGRLEVARGGIRELTEPAAGDAFAAQLAAFTRAVRERDTAGAGGLRGAAANLELVARVHDCLALQAAASGSVPAR